MYFRIVERGGAHRVQLAAREHRLQHVEASMIPRPRRPLRRLWSSSMKRMILPSESVISFRNRLQALFEFAAILRAGDECAHIERDDLLVFQSFRHVARKMRPARPSTMAVLRRRLADQHRIVLRAAREYLNDAADFFVAADDRVELALARELRQSRPYR